MCRKLTAVFILLFLSIPVHLTVPDPAGAENLKVGVFLPLSGPNAVIGHMQKNAMLLALEEVNGKASLGSERILELDIRDASNRPGDTWNIVNYFIRDKQYPLIIGGGGSSIASEAAEWCQRSRTPFIVVTGSDDSITKRGFSYVFRIALPRSHYSDAAIEFAREIIKPVKVALVIERSDFGEAMMNVLHDVAKKDGWELVHENRIDLRSTDLAGIPADAVFLAVFPPDATGIMGEISAGFQEPVLLSLVPSSVMMGTFLTCSEECRGVFSSALWWSQAGRSANLFRKQYMERYGSEPDYHAAQAYAAVLVASSALRNVDETDRVAVRNSLKGIRIGSPMGTVAFPDWGGFENQNRPVSYLFQWFGDRFEVVWPKNYRTAEPVLKGRR